MPRETVHHEGPAPERGRPQDGASQDTATPRYYIDTRYIPGTDTVAFHVFDRRSGLEMGRYLFEDQAKNRLLELVAKGEK